MILKESVSLHIYSNSLDMYIIWYAILSISHSQLYFILGRSSYNSFTQVARAQRLKLKIILLKLRLLSTIELYRYHQQNGQNTTSPTQKISQSVLDTLETYILIILAVAIAMQPSITISWGKDVSSIMVVICDVRLLFSVKVIVNIVLLSVLYIVILRQNNIVLCSRVINTK